MSERDLTDAFRLIADADRDTPDAADDLARARAVRRTRAVRRLRVGAAAAALVVVAGFAATQGRDENDASHPARIHLVSARITTQPYTFGLIPQGWSVQAQTPQSVTIAPDDGSTSPSPYVFVGKLVILYDQEGLHGDPVVVDGTTYRIHGDSGYTTVSTHTRPGEPAGVVRVQYPDDSGWSRDTMLAFLGSVRVNPSAEPGQG